MAVSRKKGGARRTSTFALVAWGISMLLVGLGVGLLLSGPACGKKPHPPKERSQEDHPRQTPPPKRPGRSSVETPKLPIEPSEPPPEPPRHEPPKVSLPKFALIIDDLGYAKPELVTRLCAQSVAFSVAVLPYQEFTRASADIAHQHGKEVMLHLPMEPLGYPAPGKDPGPHAVMFDLPESEVRARVRKALDDVPHRKGVNNHMGSRITPDRTRMTWVLQEIKARRCFFVDSRTEKDSVAFDVAQSLDIPTIQRKVFLDDDKAYPEMEKQWDRAVAIAKREGKVVIIGHLYPETVAALEKLIPRSRGDVTFVRVGELVR